MSGAVLAAAVAALLLCACHGRGGPGDLPATLTRPSPEGRAELARVVSRALGGRPVTLAEDALTQDDTLILGRRVRRDAEGRPLTGRDAGRPEKFRLVVNGRRCVLVHEASGRRFTLRSATCAAR